MHIRISNITVREAGEVAFIGDRKITWKWQSRTTLDSKRLKKDYPDIVKDYMKTTETRVFKVN